MKPRRRSKTSGAELAGRKFPEIPVIFLNGDSMDGSEAKLHARNF